MILLMLRLPTIKRAVQESMCVTCFFPCFRLQRVRLLLDSGNEKVIVFFTNTSKHLMLKGFKEMIFSFKFDHFFPKSQSKPMSNVKYFHANAFNEQTNGLGGTSFCMLTYNS